MLRQAYDELAALRTGKYRHAAQPFTTPSSLVPRDSSTELLQVSGNEDDDVPVTLQSSHTGNSLPSSPPPSFRSRTSSPTSRHLLTSQDPLTSEADRTLADTFDDGEDSDGEGEAGDDDRQRLMRGTASQPITEERNTVDGSRPTFGQRRVTELPVFLPRTAPADGTTRRVYGGGSASVNDGVFANLNAKPEKGEKVEEEKPPVPRKNTVWLCSRLTYIYRPMSKQRQMQRHHTGRPQSSLRAWYPMRSLLTACLSAPYSRSSGTV